MGPAFVETLTSVQQTPRAGQCTLTDDGSATLSRRMRHRSCSLPTIFPPAATGLGMTEQHLKALCNFAR